MGRKKVELKRIEDKNSRQVTFSKRRNGLIKKAKEISVLCDVDVALLVFSTRGKLYHFSSPNHLDDLIKRYRKGLEDENVSNVESRDLVSHPEMVTIVQRCLGNIDDLEVSDLMQLEKKLDTALAQTRSRKTDVMMESIISLQGQEKLLEAEREKLLREAEAKNDELSIYKKIIIENNHFHDNEMTSKHATLSLLQL